MVARALVLSLVSAALAVGCAGAEVDEDPTTDDGNEVKVDTRTPLARAQYDANVAFVTGYAARCVRPADPARPRVLVTGYGRFINITNNATGRIVSALVGVPYPETARPPPDVVDPPAPQLAVKTTTIDVPGVGAVDVCGMILPVYWDVAAILVAKELEAFEPSFVMMNGVAGWHQPLWLELGAVNAATGLEDGSNILEPAITRSDAQGLARLVDGEPRLAPQANVLSWQAVRSAAMEAIERHASEVEADKRFGDVLGGAVFGGFPRLSNTYLCNNVTYTVGWLMSHPGASARLLRASTPRRGAPNDVKVSVTKDLSRTPRVFVHWPSTFDDGHHAAGADVMKAMIGAQLAAIARGEAPTPGDNALADPSLRGGDTF